MTDEFKELKQLLSGGATSDLCLYCKDDGSRKIFRGVEKLQTIKLPFKKDLVKGVSYLIVTYKQNGRLILERLLSDMKVSDFDKSLLYYTLSEDDTFRFDPKYKVKVQIKCVLNDDSIINSEVFELDVIDSISDRRKLTTDQEILALEASVNNQKLDVVELNQIIAGSALIYKVHITFDSTWSKFTDKKCIFEDEYNHAIESDIDSNGYITIPEDITEKPGRINLIIYSESGDLVKRTEYSNSILINI